MNRYSTLSANELFKKGKQSNCFDLLFRPPLTFFKMFFLKKGFLDGNFGFLLAVLYSFYTFNKYTKLRELCDNASKRDKEGIDKKDSCD